MKRGYDLDGVLCDFNRGFCQLIREQTGRSLPTPSDSWPTTWNYHREYGVTFEEEAILWETIKRDDFWFRLYPLEEAASALATIDKQRMNGDQVYFITSRPGKMAKLYTEWWLRNHGIGQPTVIIAYEKGPLAKALDLDMFVDDKFENCRDVARDCPTCTVYLVDRAYNRDYTLPAGVTRVASINEAMDLSNALLQQVAA